METFGATHMQALADLLCPDAEENSNLGEPQAASAQGKQTEKYKSKAKPNFKVKTKVGKKEEFEIWSEKELVEGATFKQLKDNRMEPKYEVNPIPVGAEDVYLGLSDKDPTTDHCETLLIKTLEERVVVDSPRYRLNLPLPYAG
ncbi:sarcoma antigen NY-SAR-97, putative [Eimeria maxima]|uniref:Sarcoma antigen NY-SAR-97, putative n=1 Tax=Eimeria maxima TaxID=5804 RepID=U6LW47_EIMMA|nr:sarcoma antigen NY-SAR-97, putative [Eimeria maxima]CDJ56167.1 sarcoma antigen NY-SAR-97, putative [Eimeria maxima]